MFWKLCKHELKCSYRNFLVLYAITLLAAALINPLSDSKIVSILTVIYSLLVVVIVAMSFFVIVRNYHTSMYSHNAYLTHTLPVSSTQLLLVKVLIAFVWFVLSYVVILLSVVIMGLRITNIDITEVFNLFSYLDITSELLLAFLFIALSILESITLLYMVINVTHTTHIQRFRVPIAIILFLACSWITSEVLNLLMNTGNDMNLSFMGVVISANPHISAYVNLLLLCGWEVLLICLYFFGSKYLIDHKIEVE